MKKQDIVCFGFWLSLVAIALLRTEPAEAGGFALPVQNPMQIGRALAGGTVATSDATVVFHNPAGMTALPGEEALGSVSVVYHRARLSNRGSSETTPGSGGVPVPESDPNGSAETVIPVPTLYYARPVGEEHRLWFGFSVTSPWGLRGKYGNDWFGRYDSIETELTTVNVSPVAAFRVTDWLSVGGGLNVEYADAKLTNAIPNTLAPGGPSPATDGFAKLSGDDVNVGFNVGLLLQPWSHTRIGVHYRSAITHDISGKLSVSGLSGPLAGGNGSRDADAKLKEPDVATFGVAQDVTSSTTLYAEAQWYNWSRFNELRVTFPDGEAPIVREANWKDTWSFYGAVEQRLGDHWIVRGGAGYEPTPTRNQTRDTTVPDADRVHLGVGLGYRWGERFQIDFGYEHIFYDDSNIDVTRSFFQGTPAAGSANIRARAENMTDIWAISLQYRF
jgi:long-chain fatty acid transport protein